ncbi:hypothetical protein D8869_03840 [Streptococcus sanguinis]|uniref:Uncharacterized protein n=1 Tax=Streptococcus sanguinis TaxID=1305 RepID=A0AB74DTM5_STRSA|nr:hypothetical protein D8885_05380 [Streptococcus sanguinis]RSI53583.1 hypothetical protein D8869_03840 [Streptococcus sanguinis]
MLVFSIETFNEFEEMKPSVKKDKLKSFALCKMRGIYDERFKDLDFFPYDLLVQEDR